MEHLQQAPIPTREPQLNPNHSARFPAGIRLKHIPYLFLISETHKQRTCACVGLVVCSHMLCLCFYQFSNRSPPSVMLTLV